MSSPPALPLSASTSSILPLSPPQAPPQKKSQGHDIIALISGGKDSFLALLHCIYLNHRVVALANLGPAPPNVAAGTTTSTTFTTSLPPPSDSTSDLNSHMYQTAGHAVVPLYAAALQIPLYRHPIRGSVVDSRKEYVAPSAPSRRMNQVAAVAAAAAVAEEEGKALNEEDPNWREDGEKDDEDQDETESLLPLLQHIKSVHPTATALCSGAIFSTYQRTRLESVALRVNLQPLAPLWQYPCLPILPAPSVSDPAPPCRRDGEVGMLRDIAAVGLEARIVKVASGGLDAGILWADLQDEGTRERVRKGVGRFGGSVVGEGGEFETLVLDGPADVWKGGRIEIDEEQRWVLSGEGGEACMGFGVGKVVGRKIGDRDDSRRGWTERLAVPALWDSGFETLVGRIGQIMEEACTEIDDYTVPAPRPDWTSGTTVQGTDCILLFSNLTAIHAGSSAAAQMAAVGAHLRSLLAPYHLAPPATLFVTLLLRSMADFPAVNAVYGALFRAPLPPARVTVACGDALPAGVQVMASFAVGRRDGPDARQGLHVQSRSYWAPANIGPYSQAVEMRTRPGAGPCAGPHEPALVFVAGQIPLVPSTMEPLAGEGDGHGFRQQVCFALQHLWRIGRERGVMWWMGGVAYLVGDGVEGAARAMAAWLAWRMVHERGFQSGINEEEEAADEWDVWDRTYGGKGSFAVTDKTTCLPDWERITSGGMTDAADDMMPGFFAVQVDELPRGCSVEWQAMGVKHGTVATRAWAANGYHIQSCMIPNSGTTVSYVDIPHLPSGLSLPNDLSQVIDSVCKAVVADGDGHQAHASLITVYTPHVNAVQRFHAQVVSCRAVWGRRGVELAAGVVIQSEARE